MSHLSMNEVARKRLREAQQAEANALKACGAAEKVRAEALARLDAANDKVATARLELVRVSGIDRAAMLTDVPVSELRRLRRTSAQPPSAGA